MRRPRLTRKVIDGIIAATTPLLAGDVADAFGNEDAEAQKQWNLVCRADAWARDMRDWMNKPDAAG